jgi:hypothetical protein
MWIKVGKTLIYPCCIHSILNFSVCRITLAHPARKWKGVFTTLIKLVETFGNVHVGNYIKPTCRCIFNKFVSCKLFKVFFFYIQIHVSTYLLWIEYISLKKVTIKKKKFLVWVSQKPLLHVHKLHIVYLRCTFILILQFWISKFYLSASSDEVIALNVNSFNLFI